tara:strand:+ start:875 stop:1003 length:129 start_codon:yes stop_codon:yes gene_type:complete
MVYFDYFIAGIKKPALGGFRVGRREETDKTNIKSIIVPMQLH